MNTSEACPCGSIYRYTHCCGRFISNDAQPQTAEQLMRARYTAYAFGNEAYLMATWHTSKRPITLALHQQNTRGLSLKIVRTELGDSTSEQGIVEFVARFRVDGKGVRLHEISRFVKEEGRWFYVDGDVVN